MTQLGRPVAVGGHFPVVTVTMEKKQALQKTERQEEREELTLPKLALLPWQFLPVPTIVESNWNLEGHRGESACEAVQALVSLPGNRMGMEIKQ